MLATKQRKKLGPLTAAATGVAAVLLATAAPAGAIQGGPWSNNGCSYSAIANDVPNFLQATTWQSSGSCSNVWVQLHYTDAGGVFRVLTSYRWPTGMAARVDAPAGSTYRYSCHAGRSASHGNWSVVRKVGTGAGPCGAP